MTTVSQRLRGARDILDIAIDHYDRIAESGATHDQVRNRTEQAASAIGHAVSLLAEAGGLLAVEVARRSCAACGDTGWRK